MNSKSLIVGATGSLGPSVVKALHKKEQPVRILVRDKSKAEKYFSKNPGLEIVKGDAASQESIENALEGCSHLYYLINIPYTEWHLKSVPLLEASIKAAAKKNVKLVFPGNVYIYGYAQNNPVNENHPWNAHTKKGKIRITMENLLKKAKEENGLRYTVIRMPDFYGPYVINTFSEKFYLDALKGKPLTWFGDLDVPIELIFIEDGGSAMVEAGLSEKTDGEEFNMPGYSPITAREFLEEISVQGGKDSKIKSINSEFIVGLGGLFNPLAREFKEMMYLKTTELILDGTKYKETFGPLPATPYKEGINKAFEWVKDFYGL